MAFDFFEPTLQNTPQTLKINKRSKNINGALQVFDIKDGDFHIAYIPALNLSGYGKTKGDALSMMKDILADYFESLLTLKQGALDHELSQFGWRRKLFSSKRFENTTHIDKEGILKNFKMPQNTEIEETMMAVA